MDVIYVKSISDVLIQMNTALNKCIEAEQAGRILKNHEYLRPFFIYGQNIERITRSNDREHQSKVNQFGCKLKVFFITNPQYRMSVRLSMLEDVHHYDSFVETFLSSIEEGEYGIWEDYTQIDFFLMYRHRIEYLFSTFSNLDLLDKYPFIKRLNIKAKDIDESYVSNVHLIEEHYKSQGHDLTFPKKSITL